MFGLSFPQWRRALTRVPAARRSCQPQFEELETRLVLTAQVSLAHGVLRAVADNRPTTVTLRQAGGNTIVNGFKASTKAIKRIEILGGAKADKVVIRDTPAGKPVTIKTGGGNDTIHVGNSAHLLSGIQGNLTVDGGKGLDALFLHDSGDAAGQAFTVAANSIGRSGMAPITFTGAVENLTLNAGAGDDQVHQLSTPRATKLVLNLGGGNNSLSALNGNTNAPIQKPSIELTIPDIIGNLPTRWGRDPINLAVKFDRDLDLVLYPENEYLNWAGKGEKWLLSSSPREWYFILPNGELHRYDGSEASDGRELASGELIATLDPSYHDDLHKLTRAESLLAAGQIRGSIADVAARLDHDLGLQVAGEDQDFNWGGRGEKWLNNTARTQPYFILPNGELYRWDGSLDGDGWVAASGELVATLDSSFHKDPTRLTEAREHFGDLDLQALAAIQKRHAELGGDGGGLGAAVSGLQLTADGRSWSVDFQHGAIYHSWWQGTLVLDGGNWLKYQETGRHNGPLGLPTDEAATTPDGAAVIANYEKGFVYWSPATGVHALYGPILNQYKVLKSERGVLGLPTSDVLPHPDGVSQFATFQGGLIYSHPDTGRTGAVLGDIYERWLRQGGASGELGYPTSRERWLVDDSYHWASFQNGTIVWDNAADQTYLVKWLINGKWQEHGGLTGWMGAPLGEEVFVPGGVVQHFQNASIFYKWEAREPFVLFGANRDRYLAMSEEERNRLGLPIGNEQKIHSDRYRINRFEGGTIVFETATGRTFVIMGHEVSVTRPIITEGLTALGGTVNMSIREDGSVRFWGRAHNSGLEGYDFKLRVVFRGDAQVPLVMQKSGYVGGTFTSGSSRFDWDETIHSDAVRENFFALAANARLELYEDHEGSFTGPIADVADAALRWAGGTLLITPGVGLVIFAGAELGSLIATGSLATGARLVSGTLWMAGPFGSIYALAADGWSALSSRQRELSQEEYDWAQQVFKGTLPPRDKILLTDAIGASNRPFVFPSASGMYTLNMGREGFDNPRNFGLDRGDIYGQTFIHEMTHVWQLHNTRMGITWITDALVSQVLNSLGNDAYDFQPGRAYGEYNLEQQAHIVEDWYVESYPEIDPMSESGIRAWNEAVNSPLYHYIEGNIRVGYPG